MKQLFILLIFSLTALNTHAQTGYYKAKITLADGQINEGFAELPHNSVFDSSINFKEKQDIPSTSIKNDDIKNIIYYSEQGNEYFFECLPVRTIYKSFGKYYDKTQKRKTWMLLNFSDPLINFYYASNGYSIDENGTMTMRSKDYSATWAEILLLLNAQMKQRPHK
jgi:hypothetical protein